MGCNCLQLPSNLVQCFDSIGLPEMQTLNLDTWFSGKGERSDMGEGRYTLLLHITTRPSI